MISLGTVIVAVVIGVMPVAVWLWLVAKYDKMHRRGGRFLLNVFFMGVLAAIPASIVEIALSETKSDSQMIETMQRIWSYQAGSTYLVAVLSSGVIAAIEELSKSIGIIIAVFSKRLRIHNDGLVFGILVGLAFAVTENGVYFASALTSQSAASLSSIIFLRFLLSTSAHIIYSGIMGKYLADSILSKEPKRKISLFALAFVLPIVIHLMFNFLLSTAFSLIVVFIIFAGMALLGLFYYNNRSEKEKQVVAM